MDNEITSLLQEIDTLQSDLRNLQRDWFIQHSLQSLSRVYVLILLGLWIKTHGWMRSPPNGHDLLFFAWVGAFFQLQ